MIAFVDQSGNNSGVSNLNPKYAGQPTMPTNPPATGSVLGIPINPITGQFLPPAPTTPQPGTVLGVPVFTGNLGPTLPNGGIYVPPANQGALVPPGISVSVSPFQSNLTPPPGAPVITPSSPGVVVPSAVNVSNPMSAFDLSNVGQYAILIGAAFLAWFFWKHA